MRHLEVLAVGFISAPCIDPLRHKYEKHIEYGRKSVNRRCDNFLMQTVLNANSQRKPYLQTALLINLKQRKRTENCG